MYPVDHFFATYTMHKIKKLGLYTCTELVNEGDK
jgi:hypothetical protein